MVAVCGDLSVFQYFRKMKSSAAIRIVKLLVVAILMAVTSQVFADGPKGLEGLAYMPVFLLMLLFNFLALVTLSSRRRWLVVLPVMAIALNLWWISFYFEHLDNLTEYLVYDSEEYVNKRTELFRLISLLSVATILNALLLWKRVRTPNK